MARTRYIAGLDIGSGTTRFVVVEPKPDGTFHVIGTGTAPTKGVRKGAIVKPEETAQSIRQAREGLKKTTGLDVRHAYVGIGDHKIQTFVSKGSIMVSRADGQIARDDVHRALLAAEEALPRLQNRQMLHQFPNTYRVDGDTPVQDPVGMTGAKLEAEVTFVTAFLPHYRNLIEAVEIARITPDDVVVAHLAAADLFLSKKQKEIGVLLLNFGAETTEICIWEEDALVSLEVFPIGSAHITYDIGLGFRVSVDVAEKIKRSYAALVEGGKKEMRLSGFDKELEASFSPRRLQEIIDARLGDIFELTEKHLKKIGRSGLLPAGIVMTGGGTQLPGIIEIAKKELRLPVEEARISGFVSRREAVDRPEWATVLGLCYWGAEHEGGEFISLLSETASKKIKKFLKSLIP